MNARTVTRWAIAAVAAVVLTVPALAVLRSLPNHHSSSTTTTLSASVPALSSAARQSEAGGTARQRETLREVVSRFTASYTAYLNNGDRKLVDGSVTADAQAKGDRQLPAAFQDGPMDTVRVSSLSATGFSAQAVVLIGNREQRFPMTLELLREPGQGWTVDQLVAPDFAADDHVPPAVATSTPAAARAATAQFAGQYVAYRAGTGKAPAMTAEMKREVTSNTDPLALTTLGKAATVTAIKYGPASDGELAATATVSTGRGGSTQFSILMEQTHNAKEWVCAAFL